MNPNLLSRAQLFLRLAISASFLSAVADRFGLWGAPGSPSIAWGNWENFLAYSNSVNSFVSPGFGYVLAVIATVLEILLPVLLLIGYKIKVAAAASGVLLTGFAIAMTISFGIKAPLDYSVFTAAAACFLLSTITSYSYSVDELSKK
jgi:uncharacterized membrane protein YphA (DoxX/SURF4 family)